MSNTTQFDYSKFSADLALLLPKRLHKVVTTILAPPAIFNSDKWDAIFELLEEEIAQPEQLPHAVDLSKVMELASGYEEQLLMIEVTPWLYGIIPYQITFITALVEYMQFQEPHSLLQLRYWGAHVQDAIETDHCRVCGCTDAHACDGGCHWVEEDLCSACVEPAGLPW